MSLTDSFVDACVMEMEQRASNFSRESFDTIYFGGGTPSALQTAQLDKIITAIYKYFDITDNAEVTLETNPDDVRAIKLHDWKKLNINRLSIGIQSFKNFDLKLMQRRHSAEEGIDALNLAYSSGFENISADLIYGLPDLKLDDWEDNLRMMKSLPISHLSAYHLTIEPGTVFNTWMKADKIKMISEEESLKQYELLCSHCETDGYEHYEISNFAKNGLYSRHNIKYWQGDVYIGFGPSAHSFDGSKREWNVSSLKRYIELIAAGKNISESENIDKKTQRNELVMTGLRTQWGISKERWNTNNIQSWQSFTDQCSKYVKSEDILIEMDNIKINPASWFRADGIIADLFIV